MMSWLFRLRINTTMVMWTGLKTFFLRRKKFQSRLAEGDSDGCAFRCLREDVRWTDRHSTGAGPNMRRGWKGTRLLRRRQRGPAHARWGWIPAVFPVGSGFLWGPALRLGKSARCLHRYNLLSGLDTRKRGAVVLNGRTRFDDAILYSATLKHWNISS